MTFHSLLTSPATMKLIARKVIKDSEEEQVSLLPEDPEDMVRHKHPSQVAPRHQILG